MKEVFEVYKNIIVGISTKNLWIHASKLEDRYWEVSVYGDHIKTEIDMVETFQILLISVGMIIEKWENIIKEIYNVSD